MVSPAARHAHRRQEILQAARRFGAPEYREQGFLPEALVNFCALLGWSFGDDIELFSKEEAAARFRIEDIRPAPSAWDKDKLLWMNGQWINHRLTLDDFVDRALPFLHDADLAHDAPRDYVSRALALEKERVKTLAEVPEATRFFFEEPKADAAMAALLKQQGGDRARDVLEAVLTVLADADGGAGTHSSRRWIPSRSPLASIARGCSVRCASPPPGGGPRPIRPT